MEREVMERMSAALEALVALHAGNQNNNIRPSRAVILMKEIAYIKEFNGDKNQLTQFINVVGTHLSAVDNAYRAELWQAIYNSKITGKAKELLLNNPPQSWDEAKNLFKQHFRPACNYKDISRRISNLRVSSIDDLNCKLELIIQEINTFSTYETNAVESKKTFYTLLINRIKQLTSGNLSREIKDKFDLHEIKAILYTYIGYDYHNLDKDFMTHDRRPTQNTKPSRSDNNFSSRNPQNKDSQNNYYSNQNQRHYNNNSHHRGGSDQYRHNYYSQPGRSGQHRNSGNFRQPAFNPSGQFRNAYRQPEPMEIGQVAHNNLRDREQANIRNEEVHNIEPEFFLN